MRGAGAGTQPAARGASPSHGVRSPHSTFQHCESEPARMEIPVFLFSSCVALTRLQKTILWPSVDAPFSGFHSYIYRADKSVLDNQLVCSSLRKTVSPTPRVLQLPVVLCVCSRPHELKSSSP